MEKHKPNLYVSGIYLRDREQWMGNFEATQDELLYYSEHDVQTVEEFDIVMTMAIAQYEYQRWWESVKGK